MTFLGISNILLFLQPARQAWHGVLSGDGMVVASEALLVALATLAAGHEASCLHYLQRSLYFGSGLIYKAHAVYLTI